MSNSTGSMFAAVLMAATFAGCSAQTKDDSVKTDNGKKAEAQAASNPDVSASDGGANADDARQKMILANRKLGPLRVGASAVPHAEMVNAVIPELKNQGIDVQVTIFEDYSLPDTAVVRGDLDANFFQTEPYLWRWRAAHGGELAVAGRIHVEPMAIWSKTVTNLSLVRDGARVALPRDPANLGRALYLLRKADLIDVDPAKGFEALIGDVTINKHKLKFDLQSAEKVTLLYGSDDLVLANGNYALEAKLPLSAALMREDETSPFPNVVVALQSKVNDPRIVALVAALRGPTVRKLINDNYNGAVIAVP